ncbi:MAG: 3-methyladenine DNA glycosylase, partial [Burkholderiales bacterium]|nr:3-methyladenine DNA glycosylase [Burkholderiales bacterium]
MFGPAGIAYVYPIHAKWCFNVVAQRVDQPCAALIRAVEPLCGIELMRRRRDTQRDLD